MTTPTAFSKKRLESYITEKMNFFGQVGRISQILAIISSYFRVLEDVVTILYDYLVLKADTSPLEIFFAIESSILFLLCVLISFRIKDLYKQDFLSKLFSLGILNGLLLHIIFEKVNLISLSLTLSFLIIIEITELIQKRFYFGRTDIILNDDANVDFQTIKMLQNYVSDRIQWFTLISIVLAVMNFLVYFGTFLRPLFNPVTTTISIVVLVAFGIWIFFTLPSND